MYSRRVHRLQASAEAMNQQIHRCGVAQMALQESNRPGSESSPEEQEVAERIFGACRVSGSHANAHSSGLRAVWDGL